MCLLSYKMVSLSDQIQSGSYPILGTAVQDEVKSYPVHIRALPALIYWKTDQGGVDEIPVSRAV